MPSKVILIDASPRRANDGVAEAVRLAGGGGQFPYYYNGQHYRAGVVQLPTIVTAITFDGGDFGAGGVPQAAELQWAASRKADLAAIANYFWIDAPITVRIGDENSVGTLPAVTIAGKVLSATVDGGVVKLQLSDPAADLKKPLLTSRFGGTGGVDGPVEWDGRIKPRVWGRVWNLEGERIDPANNVYCFADPARPIQSFDALRDKGAPAAAINVLAWQGSVAATFTALQAAAAPQGGGVACPSIACVKWWTQPAGALTADLKGEIGAGYVETTAQIVQRLVQAGPNTPFAAGTIAAAQAARPAPVGWVAQDDSTGTASMIEELLGNSSLLWLLNASGEIVIREWAWGAGVASGVSQSVKRTSVIAPVGTRKLGFKRNETQMARGDLAAVVLVDGVTYSDGTPLTTVLTNVANTAAAADDKADQALAEIAAIGDPVDAISADLTNGSVQLFAYANGGVVSYAAATGEFKVFSGQTDISANFALSTQANPQALTMAYAGRTYSVTAGFDAGEDTATVTIRATGSGAYAGVVLDKVLSLSKAKGGYEIVAALPSTNLFSGRVVFNEVDDKLYRYTGTAWTAAVPAADVAGQLVEAQLANGIVSESKLKIGVGSNMLIGAIPGLNPNRYIGVGWNPDGVSFEAGGEGGVFLSPAYGGNFPSGYASWTTPDGGTFAVRQPNNTPNSGTSGTTNLTDFHFKFPNNPSGNESSLWPVEANKFYEFSAYTGAHRCTVSLFIEWLDANGVSLGTSSISGPNANAGQGGIVLDSYTRLIARGQAPATARNARLIARKSHTYAGQADSWMFLTHPMWAETTANATQAMPYNPPPAAILNAEMLVSNSILTRHLKADTIEAQHIKANIISASKMVLTNKDAIDPDPNFQDKAWWGWGNDGNFQTITGGTGPQPYVFTRVIGGMSTYRDYYSPFFPVEANAHYRTKLRIYISPDAVGFIAPTWHWPAQAWLRPWPDNNTHAATGQPVIECATTSIPKGSWQTFTAVNEFMPQAGGNRIQHRMVCQLTQGYVEFAWELTRAMNAELVVDGGITAGKIAANAITADKIEAGAITAAKVGTNEIVAFSANIKDLTVSTVKIAGNAVTLTSSAYTSTSVNLVDDAWVDVQSVTITTIGAPILILFNGQSSQVTSGVFDILRYRILRDAAVIQGPIENWAYADENRNVSLSITDVPSAGTFTYKVQAFLQTSGGSANLTHRSLVAMETKR